VVSSASQPRQDRIGGDPLDVGEYCRAVEAHLARVNEGHIVRIVGVAFDLVRGWALAGVPLSVVRSGIERKAERHRTGASRRPLRLEFCEADVRTAFEAWRRAVGVAGVPLVSTGEADADPDAADPPARRVPSLSRQIARAAERTVRAAGRLETPEALREALTRVLESLVALQHRARHARGAAREAIVRDLVALDRDVIRAARDAAAGDGLDRLHVQASRDLDRYRARMSAEAWERSLDASIDRLLRGTYGLPILDLDEMS
jgi:hypothetical protein